VQVHEVHVVEVQDHLAPAIQETGDGLADSRRRGGVDLALNAHDDLPAAVVKGYFEGM
jgi:hypothetical protein